MRFEGIAHPPPSTSRTNVADLSRAEIATTNMGKNFRGSTNLLVEHDASQVVGRVHASWESPVDGSLRVVGTVESQEAQDAVVRGDLRGLSLGTSVIQELDGTALLRTQEELSLCSEPRRAGCYIDTIDGRSVRTTARFSARTGACKPSGSISPSHLR